MNIDSKIKKELESNADEIDQILANDNDGLLPMMMSTFKGSMRRWFILINIITVFVGITLVWCGYQFFTVDSSKQMYWGFLFIASIQLQSSLKQWLINEVNRNSLVREIKRLELAIVDLKGKNN